MGDAIRRLAVLVDHAPALQGARAYPDVPAALSIGLTTPDAVRLIAADLGVTVSVYVDHDHDDAHTWFEIEEGPVSLRVSHLGPIPRELHRPVDVTETIEEQS